MAANKPAATPAKKTPGRKAAVTPPALDFTKLTVSDAAPVVRKTAVSAADNPTLPWVRESWANKTAKSPGVFWGKGKQVPVPATNVDQVKGLIRSAANALSRELNERIGVAFDVVDLGGGKAMVRFMAKTAKTPYTRKKTATTEAPKVEAAAAPDASKGDDK